MITKEYALFCELATLSVNGLHTFVNVFDRTNFAVGAPKALRGFFATRFEGLSPEHEIELYMTNAEKILVEKGNLYKGVVKGPGAQIVMRIPGVPIAGNGEYIMWARFDGGEPMRLCSWTAGDAKKQA